MFFPTSLSTGLLTVALVAGVAAPANAQQRRDPKQSPRISTEDPKTGESNGMRVTWDDTAEPAVKPAPEPVTPKVDPRTPPVARSVVYGRVVPPAPRVVSRAARTATFLARPAVASSLAINSRYGVRYDPFTGSPRMHTGVDLDAAYGSSVGASMSGTVIFAGQRGGYGNLVVVDHGSGVSTYYAHLSAVGVAVGQPVEAGEIIGFVGSTGRSTGPHLHYEVRANGRPFDPFAEVALYDGGVLAVDGHRIGPATTDDIATRALPLPPRDATVISIDFDEIPVDTDAEVEPR